MLDKGDSIEDGCDTISVCKSALRHWMKQTKDERCGVIPQTEENNGLQT